MAVPERDVVTGQFSKGNRTSALGGAVTAAGGRSPQYSPWLKRNLPKYADQAIKVLVEIMTTAKQSAVARERAASQLLDRYYGKPVQRVETEQIDTDGMHARIRALLLQACGETLPPRTVECLPEPDAHDDDNS